MHVGPAEFIALELGLVDGWNYPIGLTCVRHQEILNGSIRASLARGFSHLLLCLCPVSLHIYLHRRHLFQFSEDLRRSHFWRRYRHRRKDGLLVPSLLMRLWRPGRRSAVLEAENCARRFASGWVSASRQPCDKVLVPSLTVTAAFGSTRSAAPVACRNAEFTVRKASVV